MTIKILMRTALVEQGRVLRILAADESVPEIVEYALALNERAVAILDASKRTFGKYEGRIVLDPTREEATP